MKYASFCPKMEKVTILDSNQYSVTILNSKLHTFEHKEPNFVILNKISGSHLEF